MARLIRLFAALWLLGVAQAALAAGSHMAISSKVGNFDDIKDNLGAAIAGHGLVINNVSHVGEMLERTGKDIGATKQIFIHGDILEFCSASISRQTMEADPHNIVFCPYAISVYVLPGEPKRVYVSYRKPLYLNSSGKMEVLQPVDKLLSEIVREAMQ